MANDPEYFDIRSSFWRSCFEEASEYQQYLAGAPIRHAERWQSRAREMPRLTDDQKQRLDGYGRALNVLLVSGAWCSDCVRQGPLIKQIVDACEEGVRMRVIDRDSNSKLRDELRIIGAKRVPVVVVLTEDFFEVGRFGDQMLTTYRRIAGKEEAPDESESELAEWVDIFERALIMVRLSPFLRRRHGD